MRSPLLLVLGSVALLVIGHVTGRAVERARGNAPAEQAPPATDGPAADGLAADAPATDSPAADGAVADGPAADGPATSAAAHVSRADSLEEVIEATRDTLRATEEARLVAHRAAEHLRTRAAEAEERAEESRRQAEDPSPPADLLAALGDCRDARRACVAALDTSGAVIEAQGQEIGLLTRQAQLQGEEMGALRARYDDRTAEAAALHLQLVGVEAVAARYRRQRPVYAALGFAGGTLAAYATCRTLGC